MPMDPNVVSRELLQHVRTLAEESVMYADTMTRLSDAAMRTTDASVPEARTHSLAVHALDLRDCAVQMISEGSRDWDSAVLYLTLALAHKIVSTAIDVDLRVNAADNPSPALQMIAGRARALAEAQELPLAAVFVGMLDLGDKPQEEHAAIIKTDLLPEAQALLAKLRIARAVYTEVEPGA